MTAPAPSRRKALRVAAWTAPAAAMSVVAPAVATSAPPSLGGLLRVTYTRSVLARVEVTSQGEGLGLTVTSRTAPTSARVQVDLSVELWLITGRLNGWSLTRTDRGVVLTYTGRWVESRPGVWTPPVFTLTADADRTTHPVTARVIRTVTVNGQTHSTDSDTQTLTTNPRARTAEPVATIDL